MVYWKCEAGTELAEALLLPVTNAAKENALVLASHQRMSDKEKERRAITGELSCLLLCRSPARFSRLVVLGMTSYGLSLAVITFCAAECERLMRIMYRRT